MEKVPGLRFYFRIKKKSDREGNVSVLIHFFRGNDTGLRELISIIRRYKLKDMKKRKGEWTCIFYERKTLRNIMERSRSL